MSLALRQCGKARLVFYFWNSIEAVGHSYTTFGMEIVVQVAKKPW
jgi:hypothetical protein